MPYNEVTETEKENFFRVSWPIWIFQVFQKPDWLDEALDSMPLSANIIDVIQWVNDRPDLHNGAPFKFLAAQARFFGGKRWV